MHLFFFWLCMHLKSINLLSLLYEINQNFLGWQWLKYFTLFHFFLIYIKVLLNRKSEPDLALITLFISLLILILILYNHGNNQFVLKIDICKFAYFWFKVCFRKFLFTYHFRLLILMIMCKEWEQGAIEI